MNEQDKAVAEYLEAQGVSFSAVLVGETDRDGWACDEWVVRFARRTPATGKKSELKERFYTGLGHREAKRPVAPTAASVLYSLLMDANGADSNFLDWCAYNDSDTDSRKALATYEACCRIRASLKTTFTPDQIAALDSMLEDY